MGNYSWVIVGVTALVMIGAAGVRSAPGVMILPMQGETGWSLSILSLAVSSGLLLFGITAPFSGALMDRFGPRKLLARYYSFRGLSLLLLPFIGTSAGLAFFAILFGLDYIATVPPTISLVADTFGPRKVGIIYGWIFCAHHIGAALAAWLGGVTRESWGSYGLAFIAAGVLAIAAGMLALRIQRHVEVAPLADATA